MLQALGYDGGESGRNTSIELFRPQREVKERFNQLVDINSIHSYRNLAQPLR